MTCIMFVLLQTASSVTTISLGNLASILTKTGRCGKKDSVIKNCFFTFGLVQKDNNVQLGPTNFLLPNQLKSVNGLKNATIEVSN